MLDKSIIGTRYTLPQTHSQNNLLFHVKRAGCDYHGQNFKITREQDYSFYTIHLLFDGCGFFRIGERDYLLKKGDAFIITPGEKHLYHNYSETSLGLLWIEFYGNNCNELFRYFRMNDIHILETHPDEKIQTQLISILSYLGNEEFINEFELSSKIYTFIMYLMEAATKIPQAKHSTLIYSALSYIDENFTTQISIPDLADSLHISHTYLTKLFHQNIGTSPLKYINLKRIEYACSLLSNTQLSCERISEKIGLYDNAYFYKIFKTMHGITPTQYRTKQKNATMSS